MQTRITSHNEMFELGVRLGEIATMGTCVALRGTLGAGKTVFAKGVGAGLGVRQNITSPTFVLMNVYESGRLVFAHCDLYRMGTPDEMLALGLGEISESAVTVLEWAERGEGEIPPDHIDIHIAFDGEDRVLTIQPSGPSSEDAMKAWLA